MRKIDKISFRELSGKNINFLIGSGMSMPFIPTLYVEEKEKSLEEIFTELNDKKHTLEYYYWIEYYWNNILKVGLLNEINSDYEETFREYKKFITILINFLSKQNEDHSGKVNIFTTNYDLFFEKSVDELIKENTIEQFILNDGSNGLVKKFYNCSNYDKVIYKTGVFGRKYKKIPTINLFKVHGSLSWEKEENNIEVIYNRKINDIKKIEESGDYYIVNEKSFLKSTTIEDVNDNDISKSLETYKKIQVVSPTKKKFKDTILNENYFHQIRSFTYELEKEDSVLIIFGFSFKDEHIREIIKRSLTNKNLQVFIFVYDEEEYKNNIKNNPENEFLLKYENVKFIIPYDKGKLTTNIFNEKIFVRSEE